MLQAEFERRVKMSVTPEEYWHINEVYNNSDLDKDAFCKLWVKMNKSRVEKAVEEAKREAKDRKLREGLYDIINKDWSGRYNSIAPSCFNDRQEKLLAQAGIALKEERVEPIWGHAVTEYKSVSTVLYEIKKYLKTA